MSSKKDQIFHAVIDHMKKDGLLSNIKVAEIAKAADVGKGTVYEYFNSKEEIIAETMIYMLESTQDEIIQTDYEGLDFEHTMHAHIKKVTELLLGNLSFHTFLMNQNIEGLITKELKIKIKKRMQDITKNYHQFLKSILNKGYIEGKINEVNDPFIIVAISNTIVTSTVYYIQENDHKIHSIDEFIDKVYQLILKMVS